MSFNILMRTLGTVLILVATLVVCGLPCVARACVTQAAATEGMGMAAPALGSMHDDVQPPCGPDSAPTQAPMAPVGAEDTSLSLDEGGDFVALPVHLDHRFGEISTSGRRILVPALHAHANNASETSPRPPRG